MKILVATDGSVHASSAMLAASRMLRLQESDIDVLCVAPQPVAQLAGSVADIHEAYVESLASPARRTLKEAENILAHLGLNARTLLEAGPPAERILELAPNYDLTIVGAYGGHDRNQPGLGPVSSRVLQLGSGNLFVGRELVNQNNFRVLVALDTSEASSNALQSLLTLFDPEALDVTLMHVIETAWAVPSPVANHNDGSDPQELGDYQMQLERELRRKGETVVSNARTRLAQHAIPSTYLVREGDLALEISSEAENGGYDLVVAGATGVSDVKHAVLGSVSLKLAWDVPCSVAVIRR
jgi:nucleotide-binding universal stress UspA family protein